MKFQFIKVCLFLSIFLLQACASSKLGKVNLLGNDYKKNLIVGESHITQVIDELGEPFGYSESSDRTVITYIDHREKYVFYLIGDIRTSNSKKLYLRFEDNILSHLEVQKEGWGLGVDVNAQALGGLVR